jgi:hypothetical protein
MLLCAPTLQAKEVSEADAAIIAKRFINIYDKGVWMGKLLMYGNSY